MATTIVVAQAMMIGLAEKEGYGLVLLISFAALPLRGLIAAANTGPVAALAGAH